jgi:hypothetical protein
VGRLGAGKLGLSLVISFITTGISGRSYARSCTHKSATSMHRSTSGIEQVSFIVGSIRSEALSSYHNLYACDQENLFQNIVETSIWFWKWKLRTCKQ